MLDCSCGWLLPERTAPRPVTSIDKHQETARAVPSVVNMSVTRCREPVVCPETAASPKTIPQHQHSEEANGTCSERLENEYRRGGESEQ